MATMGQDGHEGQTIKEDKLAGEKKTQHAGETEDEHGEKGTEDEHGEKAGDKKHVLETEDEHGEKEKAGDKKHVVETEDEHGEKRGEKGFNKKQREKEGILILVSLLAAMLALTTLWNSCGQPLQVFWMWLLSLLICFYVFAWICFLKGNSSLAFHFILEGFLLAFIAHQNIGSMIGMLMVQFNSHMMCGFLGYAIAEHCLLNTTKRYNISMPSNQKEAEKLYVLRALAGVIDALVTVVIVVYLVRWVYQRYDNDVTDLMPILSFSIACLLLFWIQYVASVLGGALTGQEGLSVVAAYFGLMCFLHFWSHMILGPSGAAITTWILSLGLSGFFGYSVGFYNSYKEVIGRRFSVQRLQSP